MHIGKYFCFSSGDKTPTAEPRTHDVSDRQRAKALVKQMVGDRAWWLERRTLIHAGLRLGVDNLQKLVDHGVTLEVVRVDPNGFGPPRGARYNIPDKRIRIAESRLD